MKVTTNTILVALLAASFNVVAQPAPVIDVGNAVSASGLAEQLESIERKLDARNRAQISIQRQLDDLQTEVNELRGVTELHTHQLSQVLERQRELYQELDRRVTEALKPQVPANLAAPSVVATTTEQSYSSDLTENEAYDRAVNLILKDKRYDQAIAEFAAFNKKYPNSGYAANAHYWLGQLLFNKNEWQKALVEFELVTKEYKESTKRSDALLKLAMIAQKQDNQPRAIALYKQVISEYPDSSPAQLAQTRLDAIAQ